MKLSLKVSKTTDMIFDNFSINLDVIVRIHNKQISRVGKNTFFGVLIDEKLTWKDQINNVNINLSGISRTIYSTNMS